MYMIKITQEIKDEMILSTLKDDYIGICRDISMLKNRTNLSSHHQEDLIDNFVIKTSMEVLLKYYMPIIDAEYFIKKTLDECGFL